MTNTREEAIRIFTEAWEAKRAEIGRGIAPKGTKVGAGIDALAEAGLIDLDDHPLYSPPPVHTHGPAEGLGLDCPERIVDGLRLGDCQPNP